MITKVLTYETRNNTYYLIKSAKTDYEQQEEQKTERKYMITQKGIGIIATILSIVMMFHGLAPAILLTIVGIGVTLTEDHVIG